jgi:DNA-binding transcriptional LysR family regulator
MRHTRLLVYLDRVARTGSIRKAAAQSHVAASAISRQILALEEELGTPLFERLPRKLVLTAAGEILIRHFRETLKDLDRVQNEIEELKGLRRGEITLALMSGMAANLVPRAAEEFRRTNPRLKLNFRLLATGDEILAAVGSAAEADLGLGFDFVPDAKVRVLTTAAARLGAVMAPTHPLSQRASLRISECIGYPMIVADKSMVIRPYLNALFTKASLNPQPIIETNSIEVMRHAAMADQCITFLTPFDIEFERRTGRLVYVAVRELARDTQTLMLIGHEGGTRAIASVFAEAIKSLIREVI